MSNFITYCIKGETLMSEVDDFIAIWHEEEIHSSLHDFLGMSKKEYELFVKDGAYLGLIITSHRDNIDIEMLVREEMNIAARSENEPTMRMLQKWLENEGLWD